MIAALFALSLPVSAAQVCTNVYNPFTHSWEYQCVDGHTPQCHQEYDAFNHVWVTVCN
jgi:hypothetical protein